MNAPLRRVAVALLVLFGALFVNLNYVQVVAADRLRSDPRNTRQLLETYSHERGPIAAGSTIVAQSTPTKDRLKYLRTYGAGDGELARSMATVTGFYSLVYGSTNIERAYDKVLSGSDDRLFVRRLSDLVTGRTVEGGSVELTIHPKVQLAAQRALGGRRGAAVAVDPRTGAVIALVTNPTYDPNILSSHDPRSIREAYTALNKDPLQPMLDRATQRTYPPGSVFKVVTAAAALESGKYTPETLLPCPRAFQLPNSNNQVHNFGGGSCSAAQVPLLSALQNSYNTAFASLGLTLGAEALQKQSERFGFNAVPDLPVPVAAARFPEGIDKPQTALTGIGQFDVRVTPLQMALVAAGVANRGVVMAPYLVTRVLAPDLSELEKTEPHSMPGQPAISPATADALTRMMEAVVASGTGRRAALPGVRVAGKTGTAQHLAGRPPHAWFIGFAPADAPRIAFAVVVEDGGDLGSDATGGRLAAPIAQQIMAAALADLS